MISEKQNAGATAGLASISAPYETIRWTRAAWLIFRKDLQVELRTRHAVGSVALFAVTTLVAVSASVSEAGVPSDVKAALLWIVLLFAALSGLSRAFVREEEAGTAPALRLAAPATAVYTGKWLYNAALVLVVELVGVPLFLIVLPPQSLNFSLLCGVLALGGLGLSSAATFISALIAQAGSGKSTLFFIVSFPVLMPLLMMATQATVGAFDSVPAHHLRTLSDLRFLTSYGVVMTTAAYMLFGSVWYD